MNPYLQALRAKYDAMYSANEGIQTRAAEEGRNLSEAELASVKGQSVELRALDAEIKVLADEELRHAAYSDTVAKLSPGRPAQAMPGGVKLGDGNKPRDPGHYRAAGEGGEHSFFGDMMRKALLQDSQAEARLNEHNTFMRAETTSTLTGVVPPKWLADLYSTKAQEGRVIADAVANYTITDGRAFSLPGQTANTTVTTQAAENDALTDGDAYAATAVTVTPVTVVGRETVSRQLLDASTPAVDQLILADLTASYNASIENRLGAAIRAVGTPLTVALADFIDPTDAAFGHLTAVDAAMAVRKARFARPTHFVMDYELFTEYLKLKDADGRPIIVNSMGGPTNAAGVATVPGFPATTADGWIAGIPVLVSEGMNNPANTDASGAMIVGSDVILFESPQMSFRYEEVAGPQSIQLGLWKYVAVAVRQGTRAVKNVVLDITP